MAVRYVSTGGGGFFSSWLPKLLGLGGAAVGGPLGGAIGGAVGSLAGGRGLGESLLNGAVSYLGSKAGSAGTPQDDETAKKLWEFWKNQNGGPWGAGSAWNTGGWK